MKWVGFVAFVALVLMIGRGWYEIDRDLRRLQVCLDAREIQ